MLVGPLLSAGLTDAFGYYYMNIFFGMFCTYSLRLGHFADSIITAILCIIMGMATFAILSRN